MDEIACQYLELSVAGNLRPHECLLDCSSSSRKKVVNQSINLR
jgi:hypothetical protein